MLTDLHPEGATVDALRAAILRAPEQAVSQAHHLIAGCNVAAVRFDLLVVLLAETYQRLNRVEIALAAGSDAALAAKLLPVEDARRVVARGVSADLSVWAGGGAAIETCTGYTRAAAGTPEPDMRRVMLAGALRAVAVYHRVDCHRGRRILRRLQDRVAGAPEPRPVVIEQGYAAMLDGCRPICQPALADPLPPLPGGLLCPELVRLEPQYIAIASGAIPCFITRVNGDPLSVGSDVVTAVREGSGQVVRQGGSDGRASGPKSSATVKISQLSDLHIGDTLFVGQEASVQFQGDRALTLRLTRIDPADTYEGWCWIEGYVIEEGLAVARRTLFVKFRGLHLRDPPPAPSGQPRTAGNDGSAYADRPAGADKGARH